MANNSWAPPETADQIYVEKTFLRGAIVCGIAYGAEAMLFCITFWSLWRQLRASSTSWKRIALLLAYISLINLFGIFWIASNTEFTLLAFIDNRNYPGGPAQYEEDFFYIPIDDLGNISFTFITILADGLMLWRFYVIYQTCRYPTALVVGPAVLLYLGSCATGILLAIQLSSSSFWTTNGVNWTIPAFTLSIAFNTIITLSIVGRLLVFRHRLRSVLNDDEQSSRYTSIAAMLIESSAIASVYSLHFLVTFAIGSPLANVFLQGLGPILIIATLLVVFRVSQGSAWTADTSTAIFASGSSTGNSRTLRFRARSTTGDRTTTSVGYRAGDDDDIRIHARIEAVSDSLDTFGREDKREESSLRFKTENDAV